MAGPPKRKRKRPLLTVFLSLVLLLVASVGIHRFVPPPTTFLMVSRSLEGEGLSYRWRSLDEISPRLVEAVIASEDSTFCAHRGFDMKAIEKALKANARAEKRGAGRLRGGSTISQQTAKNVFLWPGRDWVRKGLEAGYTVLIETLWGKRRIVEVYLNVAEWAPGVYGAEAAARHWFGKSAKDLTAREAARLAAILPSPRRYNASSPGPYVRRRASRVQAAMGTVRNDGLAACVLG
ncbi:MAG: monofunctional biosynthetic peptidoglycan transglycosylase [Caulobacterales bacterium]|nr:monofunctional biosynthetic peptidoglycan transglycosylase [Caulobacterales bacterium]